MNEQLIADLKEIREFLSFERRWTTHDMAKRANGESTFANDELAVCWCAHGARIRLLGFGNERSEVVMNAMFQHGLNAPFNDDHTHAEVLAKFDAIIAFERTHL